MKTKKIEYRGGLITFEIPYVWIEEYEAEDGGMFYEDGPDTGTLRLNVTTFRAGPNQLLTDAGSLLTSINLTNIEKLSNGNAISIGVSNFEEEGTSLAMRSWRLCQVIGPDFGRVAIFTYAYLKKLEATNSNRMLLLFLEGSVRNAVFWPSRS
ncbi:hypothetical protein [Mesorhizobium sp. dw_380]|uniref:hypothetical protein n=1 Tax=Mesorhizobium sp. dw_380 TaxID=2812001 RepID=UPI001BDE7116|nr:hypothetical protein [Mesorhizobium sp. dw_380]